MNKYFVVFRIPVASMDEWQKTTSPEKRKEQSDEIMRGWTEWAKKHKKAIVDNGMPLGKTKTVRKEGITDTRNDLNYYMMVQADSHDAAAKLFTDNPHLQIPTSLVEVMEIPHMGM